MIVEDTQALENIFKESPLLIATHCEDEQIIQKNLQEYKSKYNDIPVKFHPLIRSAEACYKSTSKAVELAAKFGTRLHVLHLSAAKEMELFQKNIALEEKKITSEVCVHHLWFCDSDYDKFGNYIKWNPAIKTNEDRMALWEALLNDRLDVVATDHAPHTLEEKKEPYLKAPSGGPMVQHLLVAMLEFYVQKKIDLPTLVEKLCHAPAKIYKIEKRGFVKPGFYADLVLFDTDTPFTVQKENLLYKCAWSPFEGQ